jgi:CRISPR-associated protein Csb2
MSPVRICVSDSAPEPTLVPDHKGTIMLRTIGKGRLRHLEETYDLRKANATIQPRLGRVARYRIARRSEDRCPGSLFGHVFVFQRAEGPKIPLEGAAKLTAIVRKAVMDLYPDPVPEVISGHTPDGKPSPKPHLAVTPLPDVGHRYADGHVMGFALWLPADVNSEAYDTLEEALGDFKSLTLGRYGEWRIESLAPEAEAKSAAGLRQSIYIKPHDTWASVTPVVFGKFPKRYHVGPGKDGGKVFAELCEMIGLPKPAEVRLGPVSVFRGAPSASEFVPPVKLNSRLKAHVLLRFAQPIQGPVLLGAGRYAGFGLCRPWYERG